MPSKRIRSIALLLSSGISILLAIWCFLQVSRTQFGNEQLLQVPYTSQRISQQLPKATIGGRYAVQLVVVKNVEGEGIDVPQSMPFRTVVKLNGTDVREPATGGVINGWFGRERVSFFDSEFRAKPGEAVDLDVIPNGGMAQFADYRLFLAVERINIDYANWAVWGFVWFGAGAILLLTSLGGLAIWLFTRAARISDEGGHPGSG